MRHGAWGTRFSRRAQCGGPLYWQGLRVAEIKQIMDNMLFATPVLGFAVPEAEALNRALVAECHARRAKEPGLAISNQFGWHSDYDLFTRPEPAFRLVTQHLSAILLHVSRQTIPGFDAALHDVQGQAWINVNGRGGFNTPHDHAGFHWSGCYYVAVPAAAQGRSGVIEFLDPRNATGMSGLAGNTLFASKFQLRPIAGHAIVFPSYLRHWVYPNQEDDERISIAFNARIVDRAVAA